jgi:hypothetical protein
MLFQGARMSRHPGLRCAGLAAGDRSNRAARAAKLRTGTCGEGGSARRRRILRGVSHRQRRAEIRRWLRHADPLRRALLDQHHARPAKRHRHLVGGGLRARHARRRRTATARIFFPDSPTTISPSCPTTPSRHCMTFPTSISDLFRGAEWRRHGWRRCESMT